MFSCQVNDETELRLIDRQHGHELSALIDSNRAHLRRWHPWVDMLRSAGDVDKAIVAWHLLHVQQRGIFNGVWFEGRLCGMLNHQTLDRLNRWSSLSYWLDASSQGRGIMTAACEALISHAFDTLKLHRITIECATKNDRSRAIPERLGFRLEGIVRGIEMLHGRHVDHALYGLLQSEWKDRIAAVEKLLAPAAS